MALHLSPEARKLLRPRRSVPGSATETTPAIALRLAKKIAKTYATKRYSDKTHAAISEAGLRTKQYPELAEARVAAHALLRHDAWTEDLAPIRTATIDGLAVADRMMLRVDRDLSLLPLIAVARGIDDALAVMLRRADLQLAPEGSWTQGVYARHLADGDRYPLEPSDALRNVLCALDEGAYAIARTSALALRAPLDVRHRALVSYVFPDEPWGADDLAAWHAGPPQKRDLGFLLSTSPTLASIRLVNRPHAVAAYAVELACALSEADAITAFTEALPPLLKKPPYGPLLKTPPREVAVGLTCLRSEAAARALAPYAQNPILGPIVLGFFADAPELGAALEGVAKGKAKLEQTAARALGKGVVKAKAPSAKSGETPPILRDRPWRSKVKSEAKSVAGLAILAPESIGLPKESVSKTPPIRDASSKKGSLAAWNAGGRTDDPEGIFARFGVESIPGFLLRDWLRWLDYESGPIFLDLVTRFVSPRVAPVLARATQRQKARRLALAWFRENPAVGALGLVPDAVGDAGEVRKDAETVLSYLAQHGESVAVRRAAKAYGKPVAAIVDELLARDPLASGAGIAKAPAFLRRDRLPPLLLANGRALPDDARDALVEMLQATELDPPYAGIAIVRATCSSESLGAIAIELFEQWVMADAPGRHDWMLSALVHFPSEAGTRRLAALTREWARKNQAKAIRACHTLAALGTDFALLHLSHVAETTRYDALKKEAKSALEGAAAARGLDEDQLGDRTVGDWTALGKDGTMALSYGTRRFVISLDEHLAPVVRVREGKTLGPAQKSLPRPTKADDQAAVAEAKSAFDTLKADLEQLGARQLRRLERAMVRGRVWTDDDFRARIATHPLLVHLARRLVWVAVPKKGAECMFRLVDDGTFADARDRAYALPRGAGVRLAHPASDDLATAWSTVFAEYEILQPFPQIGREVAKLTATEKKAKELGRTAGVKARAQKVLGVLESRGWERDSAGHVTAYQWSVRDRDVVARLPIKPGISMESLAHAGDQTTGALTVSKGGADARVDALDPVSVAEVVRDVEALRGS